MNLSIELQYRQTRNIGKTNYYENIRVMKNFSKFKTLRNNDDIYQSTENVTLTVVKKRLVLFDIDTLLISQLLLYINMLLILIFMFLPNSDAFFVDVTTDLQS